MRVVAIDQRTPEWFSLRSKRIGASEVPAIMGTSDFSSPYELWCVKTGRKPGFKGNWATQRGTDAEPIIRKLYEELHGVTLLQPVVEFDEWPTLMASLDGYDDELKLVVEFKYPSKEKHDLAKKGMVPETYIDQIQAQLLVTGADTAHYVSFDGFNIEVVVVKADKERQEAILEACKAFWSKVESNTPPEGGPAVIYNSNLQILAERYKTLNRLMTQTKEEMDLVRERICQLVPEAKAQFYGLSLTRVQRAGNVDYKAIPELAGVDLEQYRKPASEVVTIREVE